MKTQTTLTILALLMLAWTNYKLMHNEPVRIEQKRSDLALDAWARTQTELAKTIASCRTCEDEALTYAKEIDSQGRYYSAKLSECEKRKEWALERLTVTTQRMEACLTEGEVRSDYEEAAK